MANPHVPATNRARCEKSDRSIDVLSINRLSIALRSKTSFTEVFSELSLNVRGGRLAALIGPSGSGKTTLLRGISGLIEPLSGEVLFKGTPLTKEACSIAFQDPALLPWLSAWKNVTLPCRSPKNQLLTGDPEAVAKTLLKKLGLRDSDIEKRPPELSRGMQARVELSRALFLSRPILLADEPFASLDSKTVQLAIGLVKERLEEPSQYCLMSIHDLAIAAHYADDVFAIPADRKGPCWHIDLREERNIGCSASSLIEQMRNLI